MCNQCARTGVDLFQSLKNPRRFHEIDQPHDQNAIFTYKSLDASTDEIRLLRIFPGDPASKGPAKISCEISHASLASRPIFHALSYTWGDSSDSQHDIRLNGCHFSVRKNLFEVLLDFHLWGGMDILIWIDAICINQNDIYERNHQVGKMKRIFEQAVETTVWLGIHYDDSHAAFKSMQDVLVLAQHQHPIWAICTYLEDKGPPDDEQEVLPSRGLHALSELLSRPYWYRMWIIQELTVAKNIVFRMPGCAATSTAMLRVQQFMLDASEGTNGFPSGKLEECLDDYTPDVHFVTRGGMMNHMKWRNALKGNQFTFHDCLRYHHLAQCSDPRDKLYALAALATDKLHIQVDYGSSVANVYTGFARAEIEAYDGLDILTSVHLGNVPIPDELPSWVPYWSSPNWKFHHPMKTISDPSYDICAAKNTKAKYEFRGNGDVLVAKGLSIGKIELLGQRTTMEDHEDHEKGVTAIYSWWNLHKEICPNPDSTGKHLDCVYAFMETIRCRCRDTSRDAMAVARLEQFSFAELLILCLIYERIRNPGCATHLDKSTRALLVEIEASDEETEDIKFLQRTENKGFTKLRKLVYHSFFHLWDRRLFVMGDGNMGMAPDVAQHGDEVIVLMGCPHPMVLRKEKKGYTVVGEAYVKKYMRGEAIEKFERGELEEEEFKLY